MKRKNLFFDLDGTLVDSSEGITNSAAYALEYYGIFVEDKSTLKKFIGPPLRDSFQEFYGFSKEKAEEAVAKYREYYHEKGIYQNQIYQGIPELLQKRKKEGDRLILATSKPTGSAKIILEYFGLTSFFDGIYGSELDGSRDKKEEVIRYALEMQKIKDTNQVLMIGDRRHDVEGAAACGISCIGVLFGFGSLLELERAGAKNIAETVAQLGEILAE